MIFNKNNLLRSVGRKRLNSPVEDQIKGNKSLQNFLPEPKQLRETDVTLLDESTKSRKNICVTQFIKIRKLGAGKFGKVYLVKHKATGFIFAMKIIPKSNLRSDNASAQEKMRNQFIRQVKIQMFLNHHNLIQLYDFFADESSFYLLMQLGCDGQLYSLMQKKSKFSEQAVSILTRQLLAGISYMHEKYVIHRDLKPENIVIIHGTAKVCDFGWSVYCPKQVRTTLCGTPLYLSPEILKGNKYNEKIDTWALGALSYELFSGQNPFNITKKEDISKIVTEDFKMTIGSLLFKSFVSFILRKDPNQRPDSKCLKTHPFISRFRDFQTNEELCQKPNIFFLKKNKMLN